MDTCYMYIVKKGWQGEETPANAANVLLSSIVVNLGDSAVRTQLRRPVIMFMLRVK